MTAQPTAFATLEDLSTPFGDPTADGVVWRVSEGLIDYALAVAAMEAHAAAIRDRAAPECVWLLEHPPLYTAGTSAKPGDLLAPGRFPVHATGRGGQYTYHGPGQRIAYVLLDLKRRRPDVRAFVGALEDWLIQALAEFTVTGERRAGRVGIWVVRDPAHPRAGLEDKIAALGVRLKRWVSFHGIALNVDPDLGHFGGIVPCGIDGSAATAPGVTSLVDLGLPVTLGDVDTALKRVWPRVFQAGSFRPTAENPARG